MSRPEPTLMFCLGATKAGTSWLHAQLARHPECHLRTLKELHYFDSVETGRLETKRAEIEGMIRTLLRRMVTADEAKRVELNRRIEDRAAWEKVLGLGREDEGAYLDYLTGGLGDRRLVADITPAYGLLPEERLARMAALLPDVRFVYLMRDPVDRLWSHVRMNSLRIKGGKTVTPRHAHRMLDKVLKGGHQDIARRSDYRAVLEKLDRSVEADRTLVMFYEDLFAEGGLERLCAFLGIAPVAGDTARRVHGGKPADLDPDAAAAARAWLAPQYDYVERRFGALPAAWQANDAKV
ncbi:sulfotransferase [Psychromarinibacter sp. C21-152]|uniref:Sulfotransferase n=1 Tax=Psychromarinibacter sediminicola TaxID=3033385 RepID=A0AAE3NNM7_9RHOB|nr:sulfotransferase [Psychromarinibacter sediminicola]MDF0599221.1 sulfotransferase [Psychromarinibacter sediminicola]